MSNKNLITLIGFCVVALFLVQLLPNLAKRQQSQSPPNGGGGEGQRQMMPQSNAQEELYDWLDDGEQELENFWDSLTSDPQSQSQFYNDN